MKKLTVQEGKWYRDAEGQYHGPMRLARNGLFQSLQSLSGMTGLAFSLGRVDFGLWNASGRMCDPGEHAAFFSDLISEVDTVGLMVALGAAEKLLDCTKAIRDAKASVLDAAIEGENRGLALAAAKMCLNDVLVENAERQSVSDIRLGLAGWPDDETLALLPGKVLAEVEAARDRPLLEMPRKPK